MQCGGGAKSHLPRLGSRLAVIAAAVHDVCRGILLVEGAVGLLPHKYQR